MTTKKREKRNFDVDDLVNVLVSLWTEDDSVFIHEVMGDQITFLLLAYCFLGARIGAFLHNGKAEVKGEDGKLDTLVFEGINMEGKTVPSPPLQPATLTWGTDNEPGCPHQSIPSSRWIYGSYSQARATLVQE